jgi:hypothetical protein
MAPQRLDNNMIPVLQLTNKGEFMLDMLGSNDWKKSEVVRLLKGAPGTQYQEADDEGKERIRDWVKGLLANGEVTVTFTKADGTDRKMVCTLDGEKIPAKPPAPTVSTTPSNGVVRESKKPRKEPDPHSIRVYDLEKNEWRSFRFDRLKKVTAELSFE